MMRPESFAKKAETLTVLAVLGLIGIALFGWASDAVKSTNKETLEKQEAAINCSTTEVSIVDIDQNESSLELFLKSNRNLQRVVVELEGNRNITRNIEVLEEGKLEKISANISDFDRGRFKVGGCSQELSR